MSASAIPFPPTRWSLIGRIPAGSGEAGVLVERYADCLARYLRRRLPGLPAADADDLVQEVLMHLLEHPDLLAGAAPREGGRFRYHLATVAFNQARNVLRRRRRETAHEHPLSADEACVHPDPDPDIEAAWRESLLAQGWADLRGWAAAGDLEPEIPELLTGHLVHGRTLRDLAGLHGLPLATCQRRIAKGLTWLRRAIVARSAADGQ